MNRPCHQKFGHVHSPHSRGPCEAKTLLHSKGDLCQSVCRCLCANEYVVTAPIAYWFHSCAPGDTTANLAQIFDAYYRLLKMPAFLNASRPAGDLSYAEQYL